MGKLLPKIPVGAVFSRLTVNAETHRNPRKEVCYSCSCACGSNVVVTASRLYSGHTTSCGCYRNENTGNRFRTHGGCIGLGSTADGLTKKLYSVKR